MDINEVVRAMKAPTSPDRRIFEVGDVVQLNSGGEPMTVISVATRVEPDGARRIDSLQVAWAFYDGTRRADRPTAGSAQMC